MDLNWYIAGRILPLGRLIGHNPPPEERQEERDLCRRLARGSHLRSEELDICLGPATWAWIGAVMTTLAVAIVCGLAGEAVGTPLSDFFGIVDFVLLVANGVATVLTFICLFRNAMLDRSDEYSDSSPWVQRIAVKLYYPRPYDFWVAMTVSIWSALWGDNLYS